MNSREYWGLSEAYAEVYAPQKKFQLWVNSLLDEGYDLSEYTWEDMYEAYIDEQRMSGAERRSQQSSLRQQGGPLGQRRSAVQSSRGLRGQGNNLLRVSGDPGRTSQQTTRINRGSTPTPTPTSKPAATAPTPKPAPSTPTSKPATVKPTAKVAPTPAAPKRTFNPLMQRTFGYQTGQQPTKPSGPKEPNVTGMKSGRLATALSGPMKRFKEEYDDYDVVLYHLLDDGYADTEEAALAIMANMSEEWRQSIVEQSSTRSMADQVTDALPWNRNTKYTTQGKLRKPGENVHGQQTGRKPAPTSSMTSNGKPSIVEAPGEWFGGLRDRARASRAAQMQSAKPTPKPGPNFSSPFAKPASTDDSGRLTTYGAGGGSAAERGGKTRAQVMKQGAKNLENKNRNPGPNFGR